MPTFTNAELAAHDCEVAAKAWDEGHEMALEDSADPDCFDGRENPYRNYAVNEQEK